MLVFTRSAFWIVSIICRAEGALIACLVSKLIKMTSSHERGLSYNYTMRFIGYDSVQTR